MDLLVAIVVEVVVQGLVLGIIGLLVLIGSPSEAGSQGNQSTARTSVGQSQVPGSTATLELGASTRVYPSCREIIHSQTTVCPFLPARCAAAKKLHLARL